MTEDHIALYGNVKIPRGVCPTCQRLAFVLDGKYACCDLPAPDFAPKSYQRVSEPPEDRKHPRGEAAEQKGYRIFNDIDEVRLYVAEKWQEKERHRKKGMLVLRPELPTAPA